MSTTRRLTYLTTSQNHQPFSFWLVLTELIIVILTRSVEWHQSRKTMIAIVKLSYLQPFLISTVKLFLRFQFICKCMFALFAQLCFNDLAQESSSFNLGDGLGANKLMLLENWLLEIVFFSFISFSGIRSLCRWYRYGQWFQKGWFLLLVSRWQRETEAWTWRIQEGTPRIKVCARI